LQDIWKRKLKHNLEFGRCVDTLAGKLVEGRILVARKIYQIIGGTILIWMAILAHSFAIQSLLRGSP
jgi:hypothetical protein